MLLNGGRKQLIQKTGVALRRQDTSIDRLIPHQKSGYMLRIRMSRSRDINPGKREKLDFVNLASQRSWEPRKPWSPKESRTENSFAEINASASSWYRVPPMRDQFQSVDQNVYFQTQPVRVHNFPWIPRFLRNKIGLANGSCEYATYTHFFDVEWDDPSI